MASARLDPQVLLAVPTCAAFSGFPPPLGLPALSVPVPGSSSPVDCLLDACCCMDTSRWLVATHIPLIPRIALTPTRRYDWLCTERAFSLQTRSRNGLSCRLPGARPRGAGAAPPRSWRASRPARPGWPAAARPAPPPGPRAACGTQQAAALRCIAACQRRLLTTCPIFRCLCWAVSPGSALVQAAMHRTHMVNTTTCYYMHICHCPCSRVPAAWGAASPGHCGPALHGDDGPVV